MISNAIHLPQGGVSKVNIATDLELALLHELGLEERTTDADLSAYQPEILERGIQAVYKVVEKKMVNFLGSNGHARDYGKVGE